MGEFVAVDFFADGPSHATEAKAICSRCPVLAECLDAATARAEDYGV